MKKRLGHRVQAVFGAFCLLLGGVNCAQRKRHEAPNALAFGRNSPVDCFVASDINGSRTQKTKFISLSLGLPM